MSYLAPGYLMFGGGILMFVLTAILTVAFITSNKRYSMDSVSESMEHVSGQTATGGTFVSFSAVNTAFPVAESTFEYTRPTNYSKAKTAVLTQSAPTEELK